VKLIPILNTSVVCFCSYNYVSQFGQYFHATVSFPLGLWMLNTLWMAFVHFSKIFSKNLQISYITQENSLAVVSLCAWIWKHIFVNDSVDLVWCLPTFYQHFETNGKLWERFENAVNVSHLFHARSAFIITKHLHTFRANLA